MGSEMHPLPPLDQSMPRPRRKVRAGPQLPGSIVPDVHRVKAALP